MEKHSKAQLRKRFIEKRDGLKPLDRARASALIRQRLFRRPEWLRAQTVLTYVSFRSEVETHKLIQEALHQKKRVVVPVVDPVKKEMQLSELRALDDLAPAAFAGLPEPAASLRSLVNPSEIDLVLVPGVVFDRRGGRIGMGGGYFDKLLAEMPNARRVALAFAIQLERRPLPLKSHDLPMHMIITEKETVTLS